MGRQFRNFLGGDGTYEQLLSIYEQVGGKFAAEIDVLRERRASPGWTATSIAARDGVRESTSSRS